MISQEAEKTIQTYALYAAGGGLIPIPLIDFVAVSGIQMDMLQTLCEEYGVDFYKHQGKSIISALAGTTLASLGASMVKAIPGLGSIFGGVSMSILSGATTYAVGQVFAEHFEQGGTLEDLDAQNFKRFYDQKFEEGKRIVKDLKEKYDKKGTPPPPPKNSKLEQKLAELKDLYDAKIVSKEEYEKMRTKIIQDFME